MAGSEDRVYDIVLWGATGFTGELIAEYLLEHGPSELRLALAGRNRAKLEEVRARLAERTPRAAELDLLVGDSHDRESLDAIAIRTTVVCTTVGPYAKYGADLVAACVAAGTHYCDLTGESHFARRMIDLHHEQARERGVRIVHCCGFDSIPSDLGTLMIGEEFLRRGGHAESVAFFAGEMSGGASGGTIASMLNIFEEAKRDRSVRRILGNPYGLNPEGERKGPDASDQAGVRFDADLGMWTGPFVMAAINTRVVRRSHALAGFPHGKDFRYSEVMSFGSGVKGLARAASTTLGLGALLGALATPGLAGWVEKRLPKPGEGPSREQRERGFFVVRLVAKGVDGEGRALELRGLVKGARDPGYGETAKMLGESALCLALDGDRLPSMTGVLTPATAMGEVLLERLRVAGMTFEVTEA